MIKILFYYLCLLHLQMIVLSCTSHSMITQSLWLCLVLTCSSLITANFHNALHTPIKSACHNLQLEACCQLVKINIRMERHKQFSSLIKAEQCLICRKKIGLKSAQGPLDILDHIMGPMGFVIHDIYQINCHTEKWWPVARTAHHHHIAGKGSCLTRFEVKCNLTSQTSVRKSRVLVSVLLWIALFLQIRCQEFTITPVLNHSHVL